MAETNEQEVELETEVLETEESEETDWKAEALKAQAIAKRFKTKLDKSKEVKVETKVETKPEVRSDNTQKSSELDSGEKALMVAYGLKTKAEQALAQGYKTRTGDDVDTLMEDDIFLGKLAKLRETTASAQATPSGTKRSTTSTKDSVDFHLEKYESGSMKLEEMPFEMREKVLEKALDKKRNSDKFVF